MRAPLCTVLLGVLSFGISAWAQETTSKSPSQPTEQGSQTAGTTTWRPVIETVRPAVVVIRTDKGQGSGFLIRSDGTIATNAHVVTGAASIEVKLATGEITGESTFSPPMKHKTLPCCVLKP
jgi:putative serine protease PepD